VNKRRKNVFDKSGGRCWYCGTDLRSGKWHVDHFEPIYRNAGQHGHLHPEREAPNNEVPACAPCNLFKSVFSVEEFRREIEQQVKRARKSSVNFRTAERFGLIKAEESKVVFWFESQNKNHRSVI